MRLYTAQEAADALRVSKQTVYKYGREGKLSTVRFGRTVRFKLKGASNGRSKTEGQRVCVD